MSLRLADAALFLAQQWPVFACNAEKRPVTQHGLKDAVKDEAAVRDMFRRPGAALIGVPTGEASGFFVVDLDVKDSANGLEWLAANEHRLPRTRRHKTRSGGLHLLFTMPAERAIRNSASKIAPCVDVRGDGGYVIVPPSPGYEIADDTMPAACPAWLLDLIDPPRAHELPRAPLRLRDDGRGSAYAIKALSEECDAILAAGFGSQESTLNAAALKLGALAAGGEIDAAYAREALISAGCGMPSQPGREPWTHKDVRAKVERAFSDGTQRPRNAPPRSVTVHVHVPPEAPWPERAPDHWFAEPDMDLPQQTDPLPAPAQRQQLAQPQQAVRPFETLSLDDIINLPPPEWLINGVLTLASNATLVAAPRSLKSFLALDFGMCIAYGLPWKGRKVKQGAVIYVLREGVRGFGRRVRAWRAVHGVEDQSAPFCLITAPLNLVEPTHIARLVATAKAQLEANGFEVVLVVLDTLARVMVGADENSAQDMGKAVHGISEISTEIGCCVLAVHHAGKDVDRGARGSSALFGGVDTELLLTREGESITITITKQKDEDEGEPITLKAKKVGLDGGEPTEDAPTSLVLVEADAGLGPSRRRTGRLSADQQVAFDILTDALASHGEPGHEGAPSGHSSIPEAWWRERFYERAKPGADTATKQKAFRRAADALLKDRVIGMMKGRVWAC